VLPETESVDRALKARALAHERGGLGARDEAGTFRFHDGVRDALREAELDRLARETAKATSQERVDPELGGSGSRESWKVREVVELHAGPTTVVERGRAFALAPVAQGEALKTNDRVVFREAQAPQQDLGCRLADETTRKLAQGVAPGVSPGLEVVRDLSRLLGLGR
jgi:hypothetical protein